MRQIEILAFPEVQILDVTGPLQVFSTANDFFETAGKRPPYGLIVVSSKEAIKSSSGLTLLTAPLPTCEPFADTLIVAGGHGVNAACRNNQLTAWIAERASNARRIASVCSGAFLLATCNLLNGRKAVTHWARCAEFAERFPLVRLDPAPIFIKEGNLWTSAGVTAGIDLALALVEEDLGREFALSVAKHLVVYLKRPGGQAQFSATLSLQNHTFHNSSRIETLGAWISDNIRDDLSLNRLAERVGMSTRSFSRHFKQATGRTPLVAVEEIRIEAARRMLEQGVSVRRTSHLCGFGTDESMRRSFLRRLGVTSQDYRQRF